MKCIDCKKDAESAPAAHRDICPDCWELRGQFVDAMRAGRITQAELITVQNSMHQGRGAAAMRETIGLDGAML